MTTWATWAAVRPLSSVSTALASVGAIIRDLPISVRRDLLLLTRVRDNPTTNAFLFLHLKHFGPTTRLSVTNSNTRPFAPRFDVHVLYDILSDSINHNPWTSSFFSMLLRNVDYGRNFREIEERVKRESVLKEFDATQQPTKPQALDYTFFFDPRNSTIHHTIPSRPQLAWEIRQALSKWKLKLSKLLIFPKLSGRSVSRETQNNLRSLDPLNQHNMHITSEDLESFYHRTGVEIGGDVEMRLAWFFNDLKARTYFAQGGTTYFISRFIQTVFNELLDAFPFTHRLRRFDLDRLHIRARNRVLVYDFSSFTSSMSEQRHFLNALSEYCRGTTITVVDTNKGLVELDLGELIDAYNRICNTLPGFRVDPRIMDLAGLADLRYEHQCAGFLGVHGNLASCTALHGIVLAFLTGSADRCSCVGDDALGVFEMEVGQLEEGEIGVLESLTDIHTSLKTIGSIALEKSADFSSIEEGLNPSEVWTYLKRTLKRVETGLLLGWQVEFPSLGLIYHDQQETTRKMRFELTPENVAYRAITHITSLLTKVHLLKPGPAELRLIWEYLKRIYRHLGLPCNGYLRVKDSDRATGRWIPCRNSVLYIPWIPQVEDDLEYFLAYDPLENILRTTEFDSMEVPTSSFSRVRDVVEWQEGRAFLGTGTKLWSLLEKLGYLYKRSSTQVRSKSECLDALRDFFNVRSSLVYTYTWIKDPPIWARDVYLY